MFSCNKCFYLLMSLLITGFVTYLAMVQEVYIAPGQRWYCCISATVNFICFLWSTLLILSMTFDRFYSIIRPHKAASFNSVTRAKITVVSIVIVSISYNIPHLFVTINVNWECVPYSGALGTIIGEIYYWLSFVIQFVMPFVLLLTMNSIIIHKIRTRSVIREEVNSPGNTKSGKNSKTKKFQSQTFAVLLLVTFAFMVLTTPAYIFFLYVRLIDISKTPLYFARYYLFYNCAQKMQFSNHGINFFLYVISGNKFRTDLKGLFMVLNVDLCKGSKTEGNNIARTVKLSERPTPTISETKNMQY